MSSGRRRKQRNLTRELKNQASNSMSNTEPILPAGVSISFVRSKQDLNAANDLFHTYLKRVGAGDSDVLYDEERDRYWMPIRLVAKDQDGNVLGAITSTTQDAICESIGKQIVAAGGRTMDGRSLTWQEHALVVARRVRNLSHLAVVPNMRGKNIGSCLVLEAERIERDLGAVHWFGLAEGEDDNLWRFYKKLGFEISDMSDPVEIPIPVLGAESAKILNDPKSGHQGKVFQKIFTDNRW